MQRVCHERQWYLDEIAAGTRSIGFEEIHTILNHKKYMERAYQLGKEEAGQKTNVKYNLNSKVTDGVKNDEIVIEGETGDQKRKNFFAQKKNQIFGKR